MVCTFVAAVQKKGKKHCTHAVLHVQTMHDTNQLKNKICLEPVSLQNENVGISL